MEFFFKEIIYFFQFYPSKLILLKLIFVIFLLLAFIRLSHYHDPVHGVWLYLVLNFLDLFCLLICVFVLFHTSIVGLLIIKLCGFFIWFLLGYLTFIIQVIGFLC